MSKKDKSFLNSDVVEIDEIAKPPKELLSREFMDQLQQKKNSFIKPAVFALLMKGQRADMARIQTIISNSFPEMKIFFMKSYPDSTQVFVLTNDDFIQGDS